LTLRFLTLDNEGKKKVKKGNPFAKEERQIFGVQKRMSQKRRAERQLKIFCTKIGNTLILIASEPICCLSALSFHFHFATQFQVIAWISGENILCLCAHVYPQWQSVTLHSTARIHRISEETISWHFAAHNTSNYRSRMNADTQFQLFIWTMSNDECLHFIEQCN